MARTHKLGDRESSPAGVHSSRCACGEWLPLMARAHRSGGCGDQPILRSRLTVCASRRLHPLIARGNRLGGRRVQPSRWSQLMVRLWGITAPNGAGSEARGTGSPTGLVVQAHGAPLGDACP